MMPHEELPLAEALQGTLAELRRRAEAYPEGHSVRVSVESYLGAVEKQVSAEVDVLREKVGSRRGR